MATLVQKRLLSQEIKKRNSLLSIIPILLFLSLCVIGICVIVTLQGLNKNMNSAHKQIEKLRKELESYQSSQTRAQSRFYEDLTASMRQIKEFTKDLESLKNSPEKEKLTLSQEMLKNMQTLAQLRESVLVTSLAIKNQRDEIKTGFEEINENHKVILRDLEMLKRSQNEIVSVLYDCLEDLKNDTRQGFRNLSSLIVENQVNNESIVTVEHLQNLTEAIQNSKTIKLAQMVEPEENYRRGYEFGFANEIVPVNNSAPKIEEVVNQKGNDSFIEENHEVEKKGEGFTALILRKAYAVKEFASETYHKAVQKLSKSNSLVEITNNKTRNDSQLIGTKVKNQTNNQTFPLSCNLANMTHEFGNVTHQESNKTVLHTPCTAYDGHCIQMILDQMMNMTSLIKSGKFAHDIDLFTSLDPMLKDVALIIDDHIENKNGGSTQLGIWKRNYDSCRELYDSIKENLGEGKQPHAIAKKKLKNQVHKLIGKLKSLKEVVSWGKHNIDDL